jgi:hypothetical protein
VTAGRAGAEERPRSEAGAWRHVIHAQCEGRAVDGVPVGCTMTVSLANRCGRRVPRSLTAAHGLASGVRKRGSIRPPRNRGTMAHVMEALRPAVAWLAVATFAAACADGTETTNPAGAGHGAGGAGAQGGSAGATAAGGEGAGQAAGGAAGHGGTAGQGGVAGHGGGGVGGAGGTGGIPGTGGAGGVPGTGGEGTGGDETTTGTGGGCPTILCGGLCCPAAYPLCIQGGCCNAQNVCVS